MTLSVGQQLLDCNGVAYSVTAMRRRTDWFVLCEAERGFLNYRYRERRLYAAGPDERLPVLLRCPCYPENDAETADTLRELLVFEATQVLSVPGARWFPEPIDLLPLAAPSSEGVASPAAAPFGEEGPERARARQTRAERAALEHAPAARRSVLAMVRPHGESLAAWSGTLGDEGIGARMHCACEGLELLRLIHQRGLLLGCFDPRDLLVDPHSRMFYLGTDRIVRQNRMPRMRRFFPPARFFRPWAAPEASDAQGWLDARSDFYTWAAMTVWLLAQQPRVPEPGGCGSAGQIEPEEAALDPRAIDPARLREALAQLGRREPWLLAGAGRGAASADADAWMECLMRCLDPDPQHRPPSLDHFFQRQPDPGSRAAPARRGWRKLFGR